MKRIAMLFSLLILAVGLASAQTIAPYVEGTISTAPSATTQNYQVGGGLEVNTKHLLLDADGIFSTANAVNGAGHTGTLTGQGYYKLGHLLAGGGATWVINTNGFSASKFYNMARES